MRLIIDIWIGKSCGSGGECAYVMFYDDTDEIKVYLEFNLKLCMKIHMAKIWVCIKEITKFQNYHTLYKLSKLPNKQIFGVCDRRQ